MLLSLLSSFPLMRYIFMVLHISNYGSFPKPLKAKEELEYLKRSRQGDIDARNVLIEHNLRLVVHIIKKYYANQKDQDDLISIGTIGLIKAVGTFDYEKGTRFATYASRCIENEILMFFRNKKKTAQDISISEPIDTDKDGNALTLIDIMAEDSCILDDIELSMRAQQLHEAIEKNLHGREKEIVLMRYGLCGRPELTQREVAKRLGISRSYVSRIEKKALGALKNNLELK